MSRPLILALILGLPATVPAASIATFEDQNPGPGTFRNDAGPAGAFVSGGNAFNNTYSPDFGGIWSGWAASSMTDTTTPGFTNQYSAITGTGGDGSATYAVAFTSGDNGDLLHPDSSFVNLATGTNPVSIEVTNTTYDYFSMLNGNSFARKFGPGDYFLLTITGYDAPGGTGRVTGVVDFDLADSLGTGAEIVKTWQTLDLTSLAGSASLRFGLSSSDNDPIYGMNTPAYFAADNLVVAAPTAAVPEPSSLVLGLIGFVIAGWSSRGRGPAPLELENGDGRR